MPAPPADNNRSTPAQFRSKLGTYLTGVVIGFLILGMIYYQKHLAIKRQQQQQQQEQTPAGSVQEPPPIDQTGTTP